jgi:hypothetical protein
MKHPDPLHELRLALRKITEEIIADLHKRLGLDQPQRSRGDS